MIEDTPEKTLYDYVKPDLKQWEGSVLNAVSWALDDLGDQIYSLEWVNKSSKSTELDAI